MAAFRTIVRFLVPAIFSGLAFAQVPAGGSIPAHDLADPPATADQPTTKVEGSPTSSSDLPPVPRGKSTVIGGSIRQVDGVRDQLTLNVFGGRTIKVLFDERTQVYRDGIKSSLRNLHTSDHVSVETMLDGTTIFARSIHMLSQLPEGECQGLMLQYDRTKGELTVRDSLSPDPIKLRVPPGTAIASKGPEASASDLTPGSLISVDFQPAVSGQNVARKITVLATPGSTFVFTGNVVFLDLHSGLLALIDPRDEKRYEIAFDPDVPISREVHEGIDVTVTANFDGTRYYAKAVTVNSPASK